MKWEKNQFYNPFQIHCATKQISILIFIRVSLEKRSAIYGEKETKQLISQKAIF